MEYLRKKMTIKKLFTSLSAKSKNYILEHHEMVRERVKREFSLIPSFVDDKIAENHFWTFLNILKK